MNPKPSVSITPSDDSEVRAATSLSSARDAPINVLIVDDEEKNLTVLESILADPSYRLVRAISGEEALLALIAHEFALLILDIQMPGMTGFELAQMVRERKRTAHVPIIFLTAYYNEDAHVLEGYDAGAVDYLQKPVNPAVLRSKVSVFAELYRRNREWAVANSVLADEVTNRSRIEEQLRELNQTLEQRVMERTQALQDNADRLRRANYALEQFAFAASHDLQEPLRNIAIYSQLFKRNYGVNLNEEASMFLGTITDGALRMTRLISDLLEYTQIGCMDGELPPISDSERVFARVLKNLDRAVQESRARITHDILPPIPMKEVHLEQLLQNLIGNALKYKTEGEPPKVHLSAMHEDSQWHFLVRDNGIGIAQPYHERIFGVFKRLHSAREGYPGTGMGLAICQRIVESYGGHIWVESEVGHGATFHFTLPSVPR